MLMPIEHVPDWEKRLARQDAFWQCEIIDRPVVNIWLSKSNPDYPWPAEKKWATMKDRWLDTEYLVATKVASIMNTEYVGDSLPNVYPNLGPEVFSAFFRVRDGVLRIDHLDDPILHDWADIGEVRFSRNNVYWKKLVEMTDALLEAGKGKFYVGNTDYHPGADAIAAFRDPLEFNMDMIERPDEVKKAAVLRHRCLLRVHRLFLREIHRRPGGLRHLARHRDDQTLLRALQ